MRFIVDSDTYYEEEFIKTFRDILNKYHAQEIVIEHDDDDSRFPIPDEWKMVVDIDSLEEFVKLLDELSWYSNPVVYRQYDSSVNIPHIRLRDKMYLS